MLFYILDRGGTWAMSKVAIHDRIGGMRCIGSNKTSDNIAVNNVL